MAAFGLNSFAQNGSPLPLLGGGLTGHSPTDPNQTWPDIESPPGNQFVPSLTDPFLPAPGTPLDFQRQLGKALFWDEQVSTDNTMSCGTCHIPAAAGTDQRFTVPAPNGKKGSLGMVPQDRNGDYRADSPLQSLRRVTGLNPPTMIGAAYFESIFWDGRAGPMFFDEGNINPFPGFGSAAALEAQAPDPPKSDVEMAHDAVLWSTGELQAKLGASRPLRLATPSTIPSDIAGLVAGGSNYDQLFDIAYGNHPTFGGIGVGVTRERFSLAIATYERTLIPNQAPVDTRPLTVAEAAGFNHMLVSGCFTCHSSSGAPSFRAGGGLVDPFDSMFTDGRRHRAINVPPPSGTFDVKTPSLRNIPLKRNFFHNGSLHTVDELVDFYNGEIPGTNGQPAAFPFNPPLTQQGKNEVKAFFKALTDNRVATETAPFDRPDLYSERVPFGTNKYGRGTPESPFGRRPPEIIANVPMIFDTSISVVPNSHNKLGVVGGPAGGTGVALLSLRDANSLPLLVDTTLPNFIGSFVVSLGLDGVGTLDLGPPAPWMAGATFFAQWVCINPVTGLTSFSNGAKFAVQ